MDSTEQLNGSFWLLVMLASHLNSAKNATTPAVRRTELSANLIHNFQRKPHVLVHQHIVNHPASRLPSRRSIWSIDTSSSTEDLWKAAFQLTPRSSMTQLFPCLVPTSPGASGAFWTVFAQALADVQPVSISGVTPTTHSASVETPRPCHTSLTAARYTSSTVVSLPSTQHLILRWSGCATAAYANNNSRLERGEYTLTDRLTQWQTGLRWVVHRWWVAVEVSPPSAATYNISQRRGWLSRSHSRQAAAPRRAPGNSSPPPDSPTHSI